MLARLHCLLFLLTVLTAAAADAPKIKVLIIDGQNNHQWATTTPLLKSILEASNRFTVDVSTTPPKPNPPRLLPNATPEQKAAHAESLKAFQLAEAARIAAAPALWAKWRPRFTDYAVIVSNYNGESWPEGVRTAFVAYVKNGGGFVSYHAADNAFPDWPEYNDMIGLGGWGDRNEKSGPYLRLRDGAWTPLAVPGPGGGHGPQREFLVTTSTADHPITRGLPATWMHSKDELYHQLRGPAKNLTVLGSAVSDITHEAEPLLLALSYGQGRVFHTALGHYVEALDGLGFQVTFLRGTEWAATGHVTQSAPAATALTAGPGAALRPIPTK
jgi:type 1 glutamine amidotransferase